MVSMNDTADQFPEDLRTHHSLEGSLLVMRELVKIVNEERLKRMAHLVAGDLLKAGVDFSKADITKLEIAENKNRVR